MKLWAGRFQKPTDELVNDFNASISFDQRLYKQDIAGSKAHAQMLSDCGILTKEDNEQIQAGLDDILADIEAGNVEFSADNEDIHMNIETLLTERIGDAEYMCAASFGLREHVHARYYKARGLSKAYERVSTWLRRAGRDDVSHRPL